jgi:hypothetical protein
MWHLVTKWYEKACKIRDGEIELSLNASEAFLMWSTLEDCADELKKELIKGSKK